MMVHLYAQCVHLEARIMAESSSVHFVEGLQPGLRRNLLQGMVVLASMGAGAIVGYGMMDDWREPAAIVGAVLGMMGGTSVSGLVLMLLPPREIVLSRDEAEYLLARTAGRIKVAWTIGIVLLLAMPAIGFLAHVSHPLAFVTCLLYPLLAPAYCLYPLSLNERRKQLLAIVEKSSN